MQLPERLKSIVGSVVIDLVALGVLLILKDKGAVSSSVFIYIMLTLVCTTVGISLGAIHKRND